MIQDSRTDTKIKEFTDLKAWQAAHAVVLGTYQMTKAFPREEIYGIVDQMRRAAISITSNIAEGFGRHGYKEKIQFYYVAHGSLTELKNQIITAKDIGYLAQSDYNDLIGKMTPAHQLLQGLISKSKTFLNRAS